MDNRIKRDINTDRLRAALTAALLVLIMALQVLNPTWVLAEDEGGAKTGSDGTVVAEEQNADAKDAAADDLLKETGEPVKCKSGTLVAPVGDLEAQPPKLKAKGAALYSFDMNKIVFSKNGDKRLEPYSTTKLLTCWLALQNLDPDEMVTVSAKATQVYENGTTIWLKEGEKISVRDLIYGAMLESGNDAAYALGEAISGSEADFAELMNKTVREWGCENTHFVNANGWKNKEHYTTANDMVVIAAKCLESKELREIATTKKYTASETNLTEAREMTNYFLYVTKNDDPLTGGKTGTWSDDDCSVVASFKEGGLSEAVAVLGTSKGSRSKDLDKLIEFSEAVTPGFAVPAADTTVETAWIRHGEKTRVGLTTDKTTYVYPADNNAKEITTEITYDKLEAPIKKGDKVGEFVVYCDDKKIAKRKLIAAEDVAVGWLPSYIYISNRATLNILKVLGVLVLLIVLLRLLRRKNKRRKASGKVNADRSTSGTNQERRNSSAREKRETRRRLREKYRTKH